MDAHAIRTGMEIGQIPIYLGAAALGGLVAIFAAPSAPFLEAAITPTLAALIFATFLQVPLTGLRRAFAHGRFLASLLLGNFVAVPLLVWFLFQFVPASPAVQLGVLLVLLTPCIDYVVVFAFLGGGDSRLVLAATPTLLVVQILLLPVYLWIFLGAEVVALLRPGPFVAAFVWFIALPLVLAWLAELWAERNAAGRRFAAVAQWFPVPLLGLTLFLVVGAELPRIGSELDEVVRVVPIFGAYVILAPLLGRAIAILFALDARAGRALVFSTGTRNSLVILPLALAAPFGSGVVAAVVVTQTIVELLGELAYIRFIPWLVRDRVDG